jgi:Uma2 family endonuclease
MSLLVTRKLFTVDDYYQMVVAGILQESDRVELIQGEVLAMSPTGSRHFAAVARANKAVINMVGDRATVGIQSTVILDKYNAPEPDVVVLKFRDDFYTSKLPGPDDILLIIEMADSSLSYDREIKAGLYASLGIPEYWIADIQNDCVTVYCDPDQACYRQTRQVQRGDDIAPRLLPDCRIAVTDLLP